MAKSWDNANYGKRQQVLLQSTNIDGDLTHAPALLVLTDTNAIANAEIAAKRYEVYDHNGNKLAYDEEAYAEGASYPNAEIWVGGSSTTWYASPTGDQNKVWLYYDYDPGSDQDDASGVWDSNYKAVWHLDATYGETVDSSGNSHTLTNDGTDDATGVVANGREFVGANTDFLKAADHADFDQTTTLTIEAFINPDSATTSSLRVFHKNGAYSVHQDTVNDGLRFFNYTDNSTADSNAVYGNGSWHHMVCTYNSGTVAFYKNGATAGGDSVNAVLPSSAVDVYIGCDEDESSLPYDGTMDEIRFSSSVRSAAWIKWAYHNVQEADNEQTWSAEETKPAGGIVILRRRMEAA